MNPLSPVRKETVVFDGVTYTVELTRFDEVVDAPHGAVYHGVSVRIQGNGTLVHTKKYNDSNEFLLIGISNKDCTELQHVRKILGQLFGGGSQAALSFLFV